MLEILKIQDTDEAVVFSAMENGTEYGVISLIPDAEAKRVWMDEFHAPDPLTEEALLRTALYAMWSRGFTTAMAEPDCYFAERLPAYGFADEKGLFARAIAPLFTGGCAGGCSGCNGCGGRAN